MGKIYKSLGLLATDEVLEKSASDLVGQYVGHTGDKTKRLLESSLGKVLLIDEAYRLADGHFAKEATDELVDLLTKPQFARKMIVILAGYEHDIERLMTINPGLASRFPERMPFSSLSARSCATLLESELARESYLDINGVRSMFQSDGVIALFDDLIRLGNWANARDVLTLAQSIKIERLQDADGNATGLIQLTLHHVEAALQCLLDDRIRQAALLRNQGALSSSTDTGGLSELLPRSQDHEQSSGPAVKSTIQEMTTSQSSTPADIPDDGRDPGVSDSVWSALEADKRKVIDENRIYEETKEMLEEAEKRFFENESGDDLSDGDHDDDLVNAARYRREQERIEYEKLRRQKEEMERRQQHEMKMQQKLRRLGICPAGFRWIKQDAGYRCGGGSHFVSDATLA
jgi:hypothetical protein